MEGLEVKLENQVSGEQARAPWQNLGFEKISARDAEATLIPKPGGPDATFYS